MTRRARFILTVTLLSLSLVVGIPLVALVGFRMPNLSMEPTARQGAWIVANRFGSADLNRGTLILHRRTSETEGDILVLKRIIGLPGETVIIKNGTASIRGDPWGDTYGHFEDRTKLPMPAYIRDDYEIHLAADEIYVLGDNRWRSVDSRAYGPIKISAIAYFAPWIFN